MKKLSIMALVAAISLSTTGFAQVTADGQATVEIISTLSVVETTDMDFGQIVPGAVDDTITMDSAGTITTTSAAEFPGNTPNAGLFTITGQANTNVSVSVADGSADLTGPGTDIVFDNPTLSAATVLLDGTGSGTVTVGGDLTILASQAPGVYTSATAYTVTVNY